MRWAVDEYFYSFIDEPYLKFNEFKEIFKLLNLKSRALAMSTNDWNSTRKLLGKPRRFSRKFVSQELEKLNIYRKRARDWISRKEIVDDGLFPAVLNQKITSLKQLQVVRIFYFLKKEKTM